jgi:hypothetical protein
VQVRGGCAGEKCKMCYFWDKTVIRNTHSQVWGTKSEDDRGRMVEVIHSPYFGMGHTHSLDFGTKSEEDTGRMVGVIHSPKFRTKDKDSRDR